jgi:uncharacterized membrane protein HdeD (DUF308 family)
LGLVGQGLRRGRRWLLVTGVLSVVAGVLALLVPIVASVATAIFIGWVLAFAGIVMGVDAHQRRSAASPTLHYLNAALTTLVGLYLLIFPLSGTVTLTFMLAVWFFGIGMIELLAAFRARGVSGNWVLALNGAVSTVLGVLIAVDLPSSAAWAIGLLVAINLVFWGVRAIIIAMALRRTGA